MTRLSFLLLAIMFKTTCFSQTFKLDSALNSLYKKRDSTALAQKRKRDSIYQASTIADSTKLATEYYQGIKFTKFKSVATFPVLKGGNDSRVLPVKNITEIPDPNLDYKLLFELAANNDDSLANKINWQLAETARIINLHVASGIPLEKITVVIVVHASALYAFTNDEYYRLHYKMKNPNADLINQLKAINARFIACGQAMQVFDVNQEDLVPGFKIALTAQTVISSYQLKGFVKY